MKKAAIQMDRGLFCHLWSDGPIVGSPPGAGSLPHWTDVVPG